MSQTALGETAPGKVANLLSNDVNRFDQFSYFLNSLWISPLLTIIVGCLLWQEIGVAGIFGIGVVLTIVPILSKALHIYFIMTLLLNIYQLLITNRLRWKTNLKISP